MPEALSDWRLEPERGGATVPGLGEGASPSCRTGFLLEALLEKPLGWEMHKSKIFPIWILSLEQYRPIGISH